MGAVNPVIHYNQHTAAFSVRVGSYGNSVVQVQRAISAHGGGWAHGTNKDHGLIALHGEIQKEGSLFQGVGTVRDDDSVHGVTGEERIAALGDGQHDVEGDVLRADVGHLFALDVSQVLDPRNGSQHRVDGHSSGCVTGLRAGGRGAGYGSSGGQNDDVRQLLRLSRS